jgi:hypothetical protein
MPQSAMHRIGGLFGGWWIVDEIPLFHPLSTLYYPPKVLSALRKTDYTVDLNAP